MNQFPKGLITDPQTEQELLKYLVPAGVAAAGGVAGGLATGGSVGLIQRLRGSPYGPSKEASMAGQDLRVPAMGGTKMPTDDSKGAASKTLQQSSAEVGPMPSFSGTIKKMAFRSGDMDPMLDDPLVIYLKKHAQEESELTATGLLASNLDSMPPEKEVHELSSLPPEAPVQLVQKAKTENKDTIADLFSSASTSVRKKYEDKDHEFEGFDKGVVDRVLGALGV
jgi:hypothetical protein